jgi:hypothetical protein
MGLEDRGAQQDKIPVDKYVDPTGNYQMNTRDYVVRPSADEESGPWNLTLPPVAEAKGRFYSIICRNADAVNFITVQDKDDSECWPGDIILNGKCDRLLAYSDGLAWFIFGNILTFLGTTVSPTSSPST